MDAREEAEAISEVTTEFADWPACAATTQAGCHDATSGAATFALVSLFLFLLLALRVPLSRPLFLLLLRLLFSASKVG